MLVVSFPLTPPLADAWQPAISAPNNPATTKVAKIRFITVSLLFRRASEPAGWMILAARAWRCLQRARVCNARAARGRRRFHPRPPSRYHPPTTMAKTDSQLEVLVLGEHPAAYLCASLLKHK